MICFLSRSSTNDIPSHIRNIFVSPGHRRTVNPSRIDPKYLSSYLGRPGTDGSPRYTISVLADPSIPALFYTVVFVGESHIHTPYSARGDGTYIKSITSKPFCGESDRLGSTILMALGEQEMKAQIDRDWVTYSCRPLGKGASYQVVLIRDVFMFFVQLLLQNRPPSKLVPMLPVVPLLPRARSSSPRLSRANQLP